MDNDIVTIPSNYLSPYPPKQIKIFSPKHNEKNQVQRSKNTKTCINKLGEVDLLRNTATTNGSNK